MEAKPFRVPLYKAMVQGRLNVPAFVKRMSTKRRVAESRVFRAEASKTVRRPYTEWYFQHKASPTHSDWYKFRDVGLWSEPTHALGKIFRRRFRIPHFFFLFLLTRIDDDDDFVELRATTALAEAQRSRA